MRSIAAALAIAAVAMCGCGASSVGHMVADGTVAGRVLAAPTCPVERAASPCPPSPVSGARVVALLGKTEAAETRTGANGAFQLQLPGGTYTVTATNVGAYASTASATVVVPASGRVTVNLTVDSGVR